MREILFRGKRIDNGEWIYGHYVLDPNGKHRIYWRPFIDATNNTYHFVIPETVGQYTGLKDKHGKKIFEGDYFKRTDTKDTFLVIWYEDRYLARGIYDDWLKKDISTRNKDVSLKSMTTFKIEVIGNLYE